MVRFELETKRLYLRPIAGRDAEATAQLMTPDVAANLTTWPPSMTAEMALDRIRSAEESLSRTRAVEFAIMDRPARHLLGWISIGTVPGDQEGRARIGFWLGTAYQGQGLMFEAAEAAIPLAASFLSIQTLEACVYPWNSRGIALIRKLGFDPTGSTQLFSPVRDRLEEALLFERSLQRPRIKLAI
ncbi:MAG TPA: GNAT family N-acetyltransferase [Sphingomicrobium sp.]